MYDGSHVTCVNIIRTDDNKIYEIYTNIIFTGSSFNFKLTRKVGNASGNLIWTVRILQHKGGILQGLT